LSVHSYGLPRNAPRFDRLDSRHHARSPKLSDPFPRIEHGFDGRWDRFIWTSPTGKHYEQQPAQIGPIIAASPTTNADDKANVDAADKPPS
jgi:hypothetical protein